MAASVTAGRALRYAGGSARGLLHHHKGHSPQAGVPFGTALAANGIERRTVRVALERHLSAICGSRPERTPTETVLTLNAAVRARGRDVAFVTEHFLARLLNYD